MKIGIIGAGGLGGTVARVCVEAGRQVLLSSRNLGKQSATRRPSVIGKPVIARSIAKSCLTPPARVAIDLKAEPHE